MEEKTESGIEIPTEVSADVIPGSIDVPEDRGEVSTMGVTTMQQDVLARLFEAIQNQSTEMAAMSAKMDSMKTEMSTEMAAQKADIISQTAGMMANVNAQLDGMKQRMDELATKEDLHKVDEKIEAVERRQEKKINEVRQDLQEQARVYCIKWEEINERVETRRRLVDSKIGDLEDRMNAEESFTADEVRRIEGKIRHEAENLKVAGEVQTTLLRQRIDEKDKEIADIKQEMRKQPAQMGINYFSGWKADYERIEKFNGSGKTHPMIFLKLLGTTIINNRRVYGRQFTQADELNLIRGVLKDEAQMWYDTVDEKVVNFETFKEQFCKQYWGDWEQGKILDELNVGKFNRNFGNRVKYLIEKYAKFKYLDSGLQESTLVRRLSRHFEDEIAEKVIKDNVESYDEFLRILKRFDTRDEERERNYDRKVREQGRQYAREGNGDQYRGNRRYGEYADNGGRTTYQQRERNYGGNNYRGNYGGNREVNYRRMEQEYHKEPRENRNNYADRRTEQVRERENIRSMPQQRQVNQILQPNRGKEEENKIEVVQAEVHRTEADF
uniref:Retrotransposon gag domain-containing protein n=1 Tax=Photinus pyralis TaxID=7054 RepID=A0A1Y1MG96_PHOPY